MSDASDDAQNYALAVVAGVVALVIAGVIALAAATATAPAKPAAPAAAAAAEPPAAPPAAPVVYFEVDSDALPAEAAELLAGFAEALRGNIGATVLISGYHDASGDPQHNADLAKRRAQAVRHALEANGVPPAQLQLARPEQTTGGGDPREARRVELHLQ